MDKVKKKKLACSFKAQRPPIRQQFEKCAFATPRIGAAWYARAPRISEKRMCTKVNPSQPERRESDYKKRGCSDAQSSLQLEFVSWEDIIKMIAKVSLTNLKNL